jgi:hypothetical protein
MDVGMTVFVPFRAMWRRMAVVVAVQTTGALAPPAAAARPASEPTGSYIVTLVDGAPTPETAATQARAHQFGLYRWGLHHCGLEMPQPRDGSLVERGRSASIRTVPMNVASIS